MANWKEVLGEIKDLIKAGKQDALDIVRRKYLATIPTFNGGRNVIAYYSGWLQKPNVRDSAINDKDKSGFMLAINQLDCSKGLDLILHTPGGDLAATESLVDYLYSKFGNDIRVIVPQLSMSAGTMIALASKEIVMGRHSNLGPIDPQINGVPCEGVLDEFKVAKKDILSDPNAAELWRPILEKYHPTFLGECQHAIVWSKKIAREWLKNNMWSSDRSKVSRVMDIFASHSKQKSHARHISLAQCEKVLKVERLENNQDLQNAVLTTHHCFMHTFSSSACVKIIENHIGTAFVEFIRQGP